MIPALIIIALLSWFFLAFRAFAAIMAKLSHEYREMIIVDCAGNRIGKAVIDTESMTDIHGNPYTKPYDDDLY